MNPIYYKENEQANNGVANINMRYPELSKQCCAMSFSQESQRKLSFHHTTKTCLISMLTTACRISTKAWRQVTIRTRARGLWFKGKC